MATTVSQAFQQFRANLEITGLQVSTVSTRQSSVRDVLRSGLEVEDSFLTGSYSRNTMIAPLKDADIDIVVVMASKFYHHYDDANGGPAGLLDLVKRTLRRTYTRTPDIGRNGQAVTIRFDDFVVDVVPGVRRKGGGYLIPNAITQSWLSTDPKAHVAIMAQTNAQQNGMLVPLIKMLKAWNRASGSHLRSFHLEVLILQALSGVRLDDFPSGARYVFDKCRAVVQQKNPDPAGYGDDVGQYLNTPQKVQAATTRFQGAFDRAIRAEDYARRGYIRESIEAWRLVLGDKFPTYG